MSTLVQFSPNAPGDPLSGARSEPPGSGKVGGLVVVHEFWGLSDYIKSVCDRLAEEGFVALAPDLFHGKLPASKPEAAGLMKALDWATALFEIAAATLDLKTAARSNGRVAVIGFCMGGGLALDSARAYPLDAGVCFYGVPRAAAKSFAGTKVPIQAHFAKHDEVARPSVAEEIRSSVVAGGGSMEVFEYDAGHAFMRSTDPVAYNEPPARLAWSRTIDFLKKHLATG